MDGDRARRQRAMYRDGRFASIAAIQARMRGLLVFLAGLTVLACGSHEAQDASVDAQAVEAGSCDPNTKWVCETADAATYGSPASGSLSGETVQATFCPNSVRAYVWSPPTKQAPFEFVLINDGNVATGMDFDVPALGARVADVFVSAPMANADGHLCGRRRGCHGDALRELLISGIRSRA